MGIEIENDPLGRPRVRLQEQGDEQLLDRPRVVADPVIAVERRDRRMLEPVQGALAGQRRAVLAPMGFEKSGLARPANWRITASAETNGPTDLTHHAEDTGVVQRPASGPQ